MSSTYTPDRGFWLSYWRGIYATPRAWAMKGENLFHAYEAVAQASVKGSMQFDLRDQALMLAGMSIEVMLKSLIVECDESRTLVSRLRKPATTAEHTLMKDFYSHNLAALASHADVGLTEAQVEISKALSTYVYWRGRFVMPTDRGLDDIIPVEGSNGLVGPPNRKVSYDEATELIRHVITAVQARLGNRA